MLFSCHPLPNFGCMLKAEIEPLETIATKQKWQTWALETNATLVFEHDTHTQLGILLKDDDGRLKIEAITENHS